MSDHNTLRQDTRTIMLVGLAHGTSHFFHFLLPPLFAAFILEFGGDFEKLAYLVTVFFVVSSLGQASSGFLVDRVGARPVLFAALSCFAASALCGAMASSFEVLVLSAMLAGLGNSPFHPVDFTILNKRVSPRRLGHAFSVHGICGALGWALAAAFVTVLMEVTGSWRWALAGAAVLVGLVTAILFMNRDALDDRAGVVAAKGIASHAGGAVGSGLAFLKLPVVWLCFLFFFWSTAAMGAIQGFSIPALVAMLGKGQPWVSFVVSGFLLSSALGMFVGGFVVQRGVRLERLIGLGLLCSASLLIWVGTGAMPAATVVAILVLSGFGVGLAGPSRDMLIKRAAPPGATGRVYGTVYSGLDLGFALAAPVFGRLLDQGAPEWIFYGAGLALTLAVFSATLVGTRLHPVEAVAAASA